MYNQSLLKLNTYKGQLVIGPRVFLKSPTSLLQVFYKSLTSLLQVMGQGSWVMGMGHGVGVMWDGRTSVRAD